MFWDLARHVNPLEWYFDDFLIISIPAKASIEVEFYISYLVSSGAHTILTIGFLAECREELSVFVSCCIFFAQIGQPCA